MRFHHLGIPTQEPQQGETYLEPFDTHCTDHERNPFGIQWMRFGPGCPFPEIVKTVPHVAFEVDDLDRALTGHEILIAPNSPSAGVRVAFILCDGAPVEFLQFDGERGGQTDQRPVRRAAHARGNGDRMSRKAASTGPGPTSTAAAADPPRPKTS